MILHRDAIRLIFAKLKLRKKRTIISVLTASIMFAVILALLIIASGYRSGMQRFVDRTSGGQTLAFINYDADTFLYNLIEIAAIEAYNSSSDPDKQYPIITPPKDPLTGSQPAPYLDSDNHFVIDARAKIIIEAPKLIFDEIDAAFATYDGELLQPSRLASKGTIIIEQLTADDASTNVLTIGQTATSIDRAAILPLLKITEPKDNVIQVILSLDLAAQVIRLNHKPTWHAKHPATDLQTYVDDTFKRAIGHHFTGTVIQGDGQRSIATYEIVGLLPAINTSTLSPTSINPLVDAFQWLSRGAPSVHDPLYSFLITNPDSSAVRNIYSKPE